MAYSTKKSWAVFTESKNYLACGSSTSSKAPSFEDMEPALISRGKGCRIWDVEGNQYIDFRCGLGPVTLGYCVDEINSEISHQMQSGIVFGHPHPLEGEVARLLTECIPCAERVRFLKTGGEAVAACIKIARNATGRNKIIHCGYNGWLNAMSDSGYRPAGFSGSAPHSGFPGALCALHKSLPWGGIDAWEDIFKRESSDIAAVVIASDYAEIEKGRQFLPELRKLTEKYGILMVIDEIVTGFRVAAGGVHEFFEFIPDMAVFSKGIANGMPVSAYLGKAELIDSSRSIGISSTFGGETLSLAAAKATINFYREHKVIEHLWKAGGILQDGINSLFRKYGIQAELKGFPVCPRFIFSDKKMQGEFLSRCFLEGVSFYNVPYVNFSHKEDDILQAVSAVEKVLKHLSGG